MVRSYLLFLLLALTSEALPNPSDALSFLSLPSPPRQKRSGLDTGDNGTTFLWVIQDTYQGKTFFECVGWHGFPFSPPLLTF
jgi:hypothetical protein